MASGSACGSNARPNSRPEPQFEILLLEMMPGRIYIRNMENQFAPSFFGTTRFEVEDWEFRVIHLERRECGAGTAVQKPHSKYIPVELHRSASSASTPAGLTVIRSGSAEAARNEVIDTPA